MRGRFSAIAGIAPTVEFCYFATRVVRDGAKTLETDCRIVLKISVSYCDFEWLSLETKEEDWALVSFFLSSFFRFKIIF